MSQQAELDPSFYNIRDPTKIWIGGTPLDTKESDLRHLFKNFGKIVSTKLQTHCCFVAFEDANAAAEAVKSVNGATFRGCKIKVQLATIKNMDQLYSSGYYGELGQQGGEIPLPVPLPIGHHGSMPGSPPPPPPPPPSVPPPPPQVAGGPLTDDDPYVGNKIFLGVTLANDVSTDGLRSIFSKYGPIDEIIITQKNHAFVKYFQVESAIMAKRDLGYYYKIQYDKREGPAMQRGMTQYTTAGSAQHQPLPPPPPPTVSSSILVNGLVGDQLLQQDEMNQFLEILDNIKSTPHSIKEARDWVLFHLIAFKQIIELMTDFMKKETQLFNSKLNVIYILNDLLHFGFSKRTTPDTSHLDFITETLQSSLQSIILTCINETQNDKSSITKILNIWEKKHYYTNKTILPLILLLT